VLLVHDQISLPHGAWVLLLLLEVLLLLVLVPVLLLLPLFLLPGHLVSLPVHDVSDGPAFHGQVPT